MTRKKQSLPFDNRGGTIVLSRYLIESKNYQSLSTHARSLMILLHIQWRPDRPVDYGVREAEKRLVCNRKTVMKAFNQLIERGFIVCMEQSTFSTRTQSKTRSWRLTWLPYNFDPPTNNWENHRLKN